MPSPIGHAFAGVAIAWMATPSEPSSATAARGVTTGRTGVSSAQLPWHQRLPWICAALAVVPDIDLLYLPIHRTATHSVTAAVAVTIVAAVVTGWVTGRISWRFAAICGLAYGSHIVMDWLGADASVPYGIQMFWPFSDRWFVAPVALFPGTERRNPFGMRAVLINLRAAAAELAMGSVALWLVALRRRRRSRVPTSVPADQRPPSV
ncbi:MAG TPA: metal-dependent hydrolase [Vicinamibacterales bacterium]|jgi:membrane-bound metal-dependent hydrolase YbcI (DUF457 family)|nr:metal-dependent hydrolase [Vicinamibacterales bacterium]